MRMGMGMGMMMTPPPPTLPGCQDPFDAWYCWGFDNPGAGGYTSPYEDPACVEDKDGKQLVDGIFYLAGFPNDCAKLKAGQVQPHTRVCTTVSHKDVIVIPVVNGGCNDIGEAPGYSNVVACNGIWGRYKATDLYARWDGVPIPVFRYQSPKEFTKPDTGTSLHLNDGWWAVVWYPAKGTHTLEIGANPSVFDLLTPPYATPLCPNVKYVLQVK
jgi:hypothetical protein